ncbi:hypothetical protein PAHAL_9G561400 [Panicum hallii]|uniref:Uncharacterized protein n=1 Tax=Panicum hallii TaxID=206008 RepID=A0A2T8I5X1_9POAL|nr:uncharacterized protein LOC112873166 isoform X2 [Panicum hallii]PVH33074.1 hypothetical protein PAHAL_9G561400 [Panicum hallii]
MRFVGERSVRAAMVWDWRLEEDGEVLDNSSARWSPKVSISISASAVAERTESMPAGPGPTSRATEASYVELVGSGGKVGRFHANSQQKPFAQAELQSPPPCICSFRAPLLLPAPYCWRHQPPMDDALIVFDQMGIKCARLMRTSLPLIQPQRQPLHHLQRNQDQ